MERLRPWRSFDSGLLCNNRRAMTRGLYNSRGPCYSWGTPTVEVYGQWLPVPVKVLQFGGSETEELPDHRRPTTILVLWLWRSWDSSGAGTVEVLLQGLSKCMQRRSNGASQTWPWQYNEVFHPPQHHLASPIESETSLITYHETGWNFTALQIHLKVFPLRGVQGQGNIWVNFSRLNLRLWTL